MQSSTHHFEAFRRWLMVRNYAKATQRAYLANVRRFLLYRGRNGHTGPVTQTQARDFLAYRAEKGLSWQSINNDYSALRLFFTHVLEVDWSVDHLARPRREKSLPTILSQEEVGRLINAGSLLKHQAFMALLYGTGLRLSEALDLKITDVDGQRRQIRVRRGKGRKDRYVHVPPCLLDTLRSYFGACRPENYLFNGDHAGSRWANRAAQYAIERAAVAAGILRTVSPHVLRHCYATHHLEKGTSILILKAQLGHANLSTTARYLHLCANYEQKMLHPLADLRLQLRPGR